MLSGYYKKAKACKLRKWLHHYVSEDRMFLGDKGCGRQVSLQSTLAVASTVP
jgi:hypothetical protein